MSTYEVYSTYIYTSENAPSTAATMASPTYSRPSAVSSGAPGGASNPGGGPGPVSGGNSGIASGTSGVMSGSMMTGTAISESMINSASPNGPSAGASGSINTNNNVGSPSATSHSYTPASTGPVCPNYNDQQYTDAQGKAYNVQCNTTLSGTVVSSSNSTAGHYKRAAEKITPKGCMDMCDQSTDCIAINVDCAGTCELLGSVIKTVGGQCGVAARRTAGTNGGGGKGVVTVTVCAARTGTKTVFTTATLTTCPANGRCAAGK